MKAVILAAGIGTRLFPLTQTLPKCLIKVKNKTILEYQLNALKKNKIRDVIIVIGHHGNKIVEFIKSNPQFRELNIEFIQNIDYKITNSSYSLWLARDKIKDGFIYLNSDLIFHNSLLEKLLKSEHQNAIIIDEKTDLTSDMFKVRIENNLIKELNKKMKIEHSVGEAVGPAKFSPEFSKLIIEHLNELIIQGNKNKWCYSVFSDIAKKQNFHAVKSNAPWVEIDFHEDIKKAKNLDF